MLSVIMADESVSEEPLSQREARADRWMHRCISIFIVLSICGCVVITVFFGVAFITIQWIYDYYQAMELASSPRDLYLTYVMLIEHYMEYGDQLPEDYRMKIIYPLYGAVALIAACLLSLWGFRYMLR